MPVCYIGIGSNLGDRNAWMDFAENQLQRYGSLLRQSSRYTSMPWGFESQHLFLNEVIALLTSLSPNEMLTIAKEIEKKSGRISSDNGYQDRPLDIDLLLYDELIVQSSMLTIPHPAMHLRQFVLVPLHEIAPQIIHPVSHQTIAQLLLDCPDSAKVYRDQTECSEYLNYFTI